MTAIDKFGFLYLASFENICECTTKNLPLCEVNNTRTWSRSEIVSDYFYPEMIPDPDYSSSEDEEDKVDRMEWRYNIGNSAYPEEDLEIEEITTVHETKIKPFKTSIICVPSENSRRKTEPKSPGLSLTNRHSSCHETQVVGIDNRQGPSLRRLTKSSHLLTLDHESRTMRDSQPDNQSRLRLSQLRKHRNGSNVQSSLQFAPSENGRVMKTLRTSGSYSGSSVLETLEHRTDGGHGVHDISSDVQDVSSPAQRLTEDSTVMRRSSIQQVHEPIQHGRRSFMPEMNLRPPEVSNMNSRKNATHCQEYLSQGGPYSVDHQTECIHYNRRDKVNQEGRHDHSRSKFSSGKESTTLSLKSEESFRSLNRHSLSKSAAVFPKFTNHQDKGSIVPRLTVEGLVLPKKPSNPYLESEERQRLCKELKFSQKYKEFNKKSELQLALEKYQEGKDRKELAELRRSSLDRILFQQARKIEMEFERTISVQEKDDQYKLLCPSYGKRILSSVFQSNEQRH